MTAEFQLLVLSFIRDWYMLTALSYTGETREEFNSRAGVYQSAIDVLMGVKKDDVRE